MIPSFLSRLSSDLAIHQVAAFPLDVGERLGAMRKSTHVTITFYPKDNDATNAAAEEAERHRTGRRSRREVTAETIVDAASLIAVAATRMSVSDTLSRPADDRVGVSSTKAL